MTYTFSCSVPCSRVIRVEARDDEDAVWKIIRAGAMTCRNEESNGPCDSTHPSLSPLPEGRLRDVVRLSMQAEDLP
jgi:hypothetical protein